MSSKPFPFSAVVGQEEARRALLLAAIDPGIGGVLLRGEKGSAKSTLARGLAALLPPGAPFVELPVGATEDRVLGSLDLKALVEGAGGSAASAFRPGLLAAAHGGVLYVDEVNLLPDQIVDGLLDAAASGVNRVERDGVSHEHLARFVLIGSMNPEEGELRPQLLDRFGLAVEVRSPVDPALRAEAVRRRLAHDAGHDLESANHEPQGRLAHDTGQAVPTEHRPPEQPAAGVVPGMAAADKLLRKRLAETGPARLPDEVLTFASRLAVEVGAESLRADLVLCRAAAALAGWEGQDTATEHDVESVAPLALGHRRRRRPFEPPTLPPDELESALKAARHAAGEDRQGDDVDAGSTSADARSPGEAPEDGQDSGVEDVPAESSKRSAGDFDVEANREPLGDEPHDGSDLVDGGTGRSPGEQPNAAPNSQSGVGRPTDGDQSTRWAELAGDQMKNPPPPVGLRAASSLPRPTVTDDASGRVAGHGVPGPDGPRGVTVVPTIRAMAERRAADPHGPALHADDVREPRRLQRDQRTIVLVVDTSGSMGTAARVTAATGAVLGLLADAYLTRDEVALVAFRGDEASEVLPPTGSVELARARLADLPTGGSTPLAEGIAAGLATVRRAAAKESTPLLVLLTDGRATGEPGALDRARSAAHAVADAGIETIVLDAEDGRRQQRLGLAAELATLMNGRYLHLASVTATEVESAVRHTLT